MLKEVYYLIVYGSFEREPIVFNEYPTEEEIIAAIEDKNGFTAVVEKRYKLVK
jgi:hypothetical protein